MTSAPRSAKVCVHHGPASTRDRSSTRTPASACGASGVALGVIGRLWSSQHNRAMSLPLSWCCGLAALAAAACSPALNWREIHLAEGDVTALFPCRPERFVRDIQLAAKPVRMVLLSCEAAGATYGLSQVDMGDPA